MFTKTMTDTNSNVDQIEIFNTAKNKKKHF